MNAQTAASQAAKSEADQGKGTGDAANAMFANLPTVTLNDVKVEDLSGLETSAARKYSKVNDAAIAAHMPIQSGWKHAEAVFVPGNTTKDFRAGSVFGTVVDTVKRAGRQGINSYELANALRKAQVGNKRSHYCEKLPPVGWAEGYINSAVTQGLINVHTTKKAPSLAVAAAQAADAGDKKDGTNG